MSSTYVKKHPTVGILVETSSGWGRRVVQGVLSYEQEHGPWYVWVEARGRTESLRLPEGWRGDGVIARIVNDEMTRNLTEAGIPVVNVSGIQVMEAMAFPRVTLDYPAACQLAYEHFQDRGFQHFGYLGPLRLAYVKRHQNAYARTLRDHGRECHVFDPDLDRGPRYWESLMNALQDWLKSLPKPVGIFAWGEDAGRSVIHACMWAGLSVPHDVAVLGTDHDPVLCNASHPPLSGLLTPAEQIGRKAAEILDQLMRGETPAQAEVYIAPERIMAMASTDTLAVEDPRLVQALTFVREHACENIRVEDILRKVPMARRSLERKFQKAIGHSPFEEIRRLRIARARTLLADTDLPMQEIAEACGYATYNYLTYAFKRETGMTPSGYRKQSRGR